MKKRTRSQVLREIAHANIPSGFDMTSQIIMRLKERKMMNTKHRLKISRIMVVAILLMTTLLIGSPAISAAIHHWLGYIPGFGLTSGQQIRVLDKPVSIEQNAIVLTVKKAVSSDEKTLITYELEGVGEEMYSYDSLENACFREEDKPVILLPDGQLLEVISFGGGEGPTIAHYDAEAIFPKIPTDVTEARLIINCVARTMPEYVPQHWEIPLRFVPEINPALTPVLKMTAMPAAQQERLSLAHVLETEDGYILAGTIFVEAPANYIITERGGFLKDVTFLDANGFVATPEDYIIIGEHEFQVEGAPHDFYDIDIVDLPENTYYWAYQLYGENIQWPITMTVHSIEARGSQLPQEQFQVDVGNNPQENQTWLLNQNINLGVETIHIISLRRITAPSGLNGYEFALTDNPNVFLSLEIQGYQRLGGGGNCILDDYGTICDMLLYHEPVPDGVLTILVSGHERARLTGPWQVTWQTPSTLDD